MTAEHTSEADIRRLLLSGAGDEEVCNAYDRLLTSLNGPTATVHRMGAVGFICAQRPHLAERLLEYPVYGYLIHGNPTAGGIVRNAVAKSQEGWVSEIAGSDGSRWLREELPKLEGLISRLLWEVELIRVLDTFDTHPPLTEDDWQTSQNIQRLWNQFPGRPSLHKRALFLAQICSVGERYFHDHDAFSNVRRRFESRAEVDFKGDEITELPEMYLAWRGDEWNLTTDENSKLAERLRDIFGNPFRPVTFNPAWRTEAAVSIAQAAYDTREFGNLPVLADALQDAGCEHPDILTHLRGPGPHVRGCWVVDLVLGKT